MHLKGAKACSQHSERQYVNIVPIQKASLFCWKRSEPKHPPGCARRAAAEPRAPPSGCRARRTAEAPPAGAAAAARPRPHPPHGPPRRLRPRRCAGWGQPRRRHLLPVRGSPSLRRPRRWRSSLLPPRGGEEEKPFPWAVCVKCHASSW